MLSIGTGSCKDKAATEEARFKKEGTKAFTKQPGASLKGLGEKVLDTIMNSEHQWLGAASAMGQSTGHPINYARLRLQSDGPGATISTEPNKGQAEEEVAIRAFRINPPLSHVPKFTDHKAIPAMQTEVSDWLKGLGAPKIEEVACALIAGLFYFQVTSSDPTMVQGNIRCKIGPGHSKYETLIEAVEKGIFSVSANAAFSTAAGPSPSDPADPWGIQWVVRDLPEALNTLLTIRLTLPGKSPWHISGSPLIIDDRLRYPSPTRRRS